GGAEDGEGPEAGGHGEVEPVADGKAAPRGQRLADQDRVRLVQEDERILDECARLTRGIVDPYGVVVSEVHPEDVEQLSASVVGECHAGDEGDGELHATHAAHGGDQVFPDRDTAVCDD